MITVQFAGTGKTVPLETVKRWRKALRREVNHIRLRPYEPRHPSKLIRKMTGVSDSVSNEQLLECLDGLCGREKHGN